MATAIIIPGMKGAGFARVVAAPVRSGERVSSGQTVLEVENHKALQEIEAPADGIIFHDLEAGDLVHVDMPVAFLAGKKEGAALIRRTRAAKIPPADYVAASEIGDKQQGDAQSVAKATEIAVLGEGAGNSLLATLGIVIGPVRRSRETPSFFADKILDLVVFEASRLLMGNYRKLNSRYSAGRTIAHERIVAGISFDDGGRLTIYGLPDSDALSLAEVQDRIVDGLMRYVGRKLSVEDVSTATFTITDTTSTELNLSVPLLPRDQCIIISITKDLEGSFRLSISYDHRITEGLTVAGFAGELARRVRSYTAPQPEPEEPSCAFCERTASMEIADFRRRGLLRIVDASGQELWCCATCWEHW